MNKIVIIVVIIIVLFLSFKKATKSYSIGVSKENNFIWNDFEISDIKQKLNIELMKATKITEKERGEIIECFVNEVVSQSTYLRTFNYPQLTEILTRVNEGGEISPDIWRIYINCVKKVLPGIGEYKGRKDFITPLKK